MRFETASLIHKIILILNGIRVVASFDSPSSVKRYKLSMGFLMQSQKEKENFSKSNENTVADNETFLISSSKIFDSEEIYEGNLTSVASTVDEVTEASLVVDSVLVSESEEDPFIEKPSPPTSKESSVSLGLRWDDDTVKKEWGGTCGAKDWDHCSQIKSWGGDYIVRTKMEPIVETIGNHVVDCNYDEMYCLRNGWTVSRCHLLCMSACNKDIFQSWDEFVSEEGACPLEV